MHSSTICKLTTIPTDMYEFAFVHEGVSICVPKPTHALMWLCSCHTYMQSSHAINISPTAANGLQSQHSAAVPMTPSSHTLRGVRFDVGSGGRDMPVSPMLASRPPLPHAPHAALGRTTTSERTPFTEAVAGHVFMSPSTVHAGAHSRSPPQQSQRVGLKELTTQQSPSSSPDSAVRHAKAQAAVQAALASVPRRQRNKPTKRSLLEDMSVWETNPQK